MVERLPLKVVPTLQKDFYRPEGGGGPKKVFANVTNEFRQKLSSEVITIRDQLSSTFKEFPSVPAVARVRVRPDAIAKSHRPVEVFSTATCPIIGAEGLGDLLVSVTKAGLENLAMKIEHGASIQTVANLSTLKSLETYKPIVENPPDHIAKVKLFRHNQRILDAAVDETFFKLIKRFGITEPRRLRYGRGLKIYRIEVKNSDLIEVLKVYVGTQSIGPFPLYTPVHSTAVTVRNLQPEDFPSPEHGIDYPVIGIVDSGTEIEDQYLSPWRSAREVYIAAEEQDNTHGSFVAGLVVHSRRLNHGDEQFPMCSARIVDIVALSKRGTSEDKLISTLEAALENHRNVKIWNLSLGTEKCVSDQTFSDLGVALDRLQDEYGVLFVIAAGNYRVPPFRGWPPPDLGERDRVCAPADSVRAIVVGSIAHREHSSSRVKTGQPSPFSRRGPGPLYLPKPEVSHLGGNCNASGGSTQIGVLSLDGRGNVAEDVGTSFATPLVTTLLANVNHRLIGEGSPLLSRALIVHSAAIRGGKIDPQLLRYQGFGMPSDLETIFGCDAWQCTTIFDLDINPMVAYEKAVFPMPSCLYMNENTIRANIVMTLIHEPELDASFGSEYCRSNIEVSLGTYDPGKDGNRHQKKQVPEDPKLRGRAYEKELVEHGFKWSPVKVYRREMVRGIRGKTWRLDVSIHHRANYVSFDPERAVLIITVSDPQKQAPVYNDMVVQMAQLGWSAVDLQLRPRVKT